MSGARLRIRFDDTSIDDCVCLLAVPQKAVAEPGYIKGVSAGTAASKHEFHALAQTAYYQYQDEELDLVRSTGMIAFSGEDGGRLDDGLVIYRDGGGAIGAVSTPGAAVKKLLEAANRYCTRWVRLDI